MAMHFCASVLDYSTRGRRYGWQRLNIHHQSMHVYMWCSPDLNEIIREPYTMRWQLLLQLCSHAIWALVTMDGEASVPFSASMLITELMNGVMEWACSAAAPVTARWVPAAHLELRGEGDRSRVLNP